MKEFIDIIKSDKKSKILFIITIGVLFICTISYSLSIFSNNKQGKAANIIVNGLSFNMTTNAGESDDRILKLKANTLESFNVTLTNLNTMDVKYEIIYEVCTDSNCNNKIDKLPNGVSVGISNDSVGKITDLIEKDNNRIILLMTNNTSSEDYYIKLNLNAGYSWNELALINQIDIFSGIQNNIEFIAYVDGIEQSNFPNSCNYSYTYKTYLNGVETTDSDVTLKCNFLTGKWDITIKNLPSKVSLWFTKGEGDILTEYIATLDKTEHGIIVDDTVNTNLRYAGSSPKNYITFNDELWRIIGVFETDDYDLNGKKLGTKSKKVKIIKDTTLTNYAWNDNDKYYNNWPDASLNTYLNNNYISEIKDTSELQIAETTWNLGGWTSSSVSAANMYTYERGENIYTGDAIDRSKTWQGKIALMYPSDYGYASTNANCRSNISSTDCVNDNWLYNSGMVTDYYSLLSSYSNKTANVFIVDSSGKVTSDGAIGANGIRPSLYLRADTIKLSGEGTSGKPYQITNFDTSFATLTINTEAGATVTAVREDQTKTVTADTSGEAILENILKGKWKVSISKNNNTVTKEIIVNNDKTETITFFTATITVTAPANSTCSCSDGITNLTSTSNPSNFTIPNKGEWNIYCTNGTDSAAKKINITTDGQSENVSLNYVLWLFNYEIDYLNNKVTGGIHKDSPTGSNLSITSGVGIGIPRDGGNDHLYHHRYSYLGKTINVTKYDQLVEKSKHNSDRVPGDTVQVVNESISSVLAEIEAAKINAMQTLTINLSNITGNVYIRLDNYNMGNDWWDLKQLYLVNSAVTS